ncbi:DNA methyltransferase [Hyphobacterium sp.]|uniref:DNA methyltransferase n=1 Tax=Hyphobacterium sp. TaxID=2004662 RepID=UPI003748622C
MPVSNIPQIDMVPLGDLRARGSNPRKHPQKQIELIAKSIQNFGFTAPVLIDEANGIVAGHARIEAAKSIGMEAVPVVRLAHLSEAQIRAYVIADNKLAERSDWDSDLLRIELSAIADLDFDLGDLGFEAPELDILFADNVEDDDDPPQMVDRATKAISQPGDIWQIGPHRLGVGDIRDESLLNALMDGREARMVLVDPPYNVKIASHVQVKPKTDHAEFAFASGEMSSEEFASFLSDTFKPMRNHLVDGGLFYSWMDWRHLPELNRAAFCLGMDQINLCVWCKTNAGMGSLYRSQHELCVVFKWGNQPHINNVELGKHGRNRSNVWDHAGMTSFGAERDDALKDHPTVKPVKLLADAIQDVTHRSDIILDGFAGSGSSLVAAHQTDRIGIGVEIDPHYCDVALRRLSQTTGLPPIHSATNDTFETRAKAQNQQETAK